MGQASRVISKQQFSLAYKIGGKLHCQCFPKGEITLPTRIISALRTNKKAGATSDFEALEASEQVIVEELPDPPAGAGRDEPVIEAAEPIEAPKSSKKGGSK